MHSQLVNVRAELAELAQATWPAFVPGRFRGPLGFALFATLWNWVPVAVVVLAERSWRARPEQRSIGVGFRFDLAAWFLVDRLTVSLVVCTLLGAEVVNPWWDEHFGFMTIDLNRYLPTWSLAIVSFVLADFFGWIHHYVKHKVRALWVFHAVHHSQEELNYFTDFRVHAIDRAISAWIVLLPALILRVDVAWAIWMVPATSVAGHLIHSNLTWDYGFLRYLFVSPQSHRLHHSREARHVDCNFGVVLSIWDRMFGTHVEEPGMYPETGIDDPGFPHERSTSARAMAASYAAQQVYPFRQIWRRIATGGWDEPAAASAREVEREKRRVARDAVASEHAP